MLVLSRKPGEQVVIGNGVTVTVLGVIGNRVRVGIDAPDQVRILRAELAGGRGQPPGGQQSVERAPLYGGQTGRPPP
jgi:carbon storage regulator